MKKIFLISTWLFLFAAINISWTSADADEINNSANVTSLTAAAFTSIETEAATIYAQLALEEKGLSQKAFEYAYKGYKRLQEKGVIDQQILSICDFSQSSNNKRLYIVDLESDELLINTYVAHGRNSGAEFANKFSNKPSSLQSSLGFYVTENTYFGEHGLSLKVQGLEPGFNNNALRRAIVVHGADYIGERWLNGSDYMGRSFGCPAIPSEERDNVINTIKNGTCLFIYHPSKNYLQGSKILNY